jgi:enolase
MFNYQVNEMGTVSDAIRYARMAIASGWSVIVSDMIGESGANAHFYKWL